MPWTWIGWYVLPTLLCALWLAPWWAWSEQHPKRLSLAERDLQAAQRLHRWATDSAPRWRWWAVRLLSSSGDGGLWFPLSAAYFWATGSALALHVLLEGCVAAACLELSVKAVVRRRRPPHNTRAVYIAPAEKFSFPSGHATRAFALAVLLSHDLPHPASMEARPLWHTWALLVAASRVAIGRHYPSDVLAAALLGPLALMVAREALPLQTYVVVPLQRLHDAYGPARFTG